MENLDQHYHIGDSVFETEENDIQDKGFVEGDKAKMYEERDYIFYPNIVLEAETLLEHQITLLNNIIAKASLIDKSDYRVYLKMKGIDKGVEIGVLPKERLHVVLGKAFESFEKKIMISDKEVYEGDLVYTFIPPRIEMY